MLQAGRSDLPFFGRRHESHPWQPNALQPAFEQCRRAVPPCGVNKHQVLGFAQSIENAASPITAFLIGPLTPFVLIPFMTTGAGVELIGGWFGTGDGRGMALTFIIAAFIGLVVTIAAMYSRAYRILAAEYEKPSAL